jgi:hypothetical protein
MAESGAAAFRGDAVCGGGRTRAQDAPDKKKNQTMVWFLFLKFSLENFKNP